MFSALEKCPGHRPDNEVRRLHHHRRTARLALTEWSNLMWEQWKKGFNGSSTAEMMETALKSTVLLEPMGAS